MKRNEKRLLGVGSILLVAFAIWTILIQTVDVRPVGQNGTDIGFATFNCWFHELTGVHLSIYNLTDCLELLPLCICTFFGGLGLCQLINRKSLSKVDQDIMILGIYYLIVIMTFTIFEIIPVNYRPILIEGKLEASYPSSTTLLVLSVMPTFVEQIRRRLNNVRVQKILSIVTIFYMIFMVGGRLISGVHWFTDIVGSVLFSAGLFCIYKAIIMKIIKENQ